MRDGAMAVVSLAVVANHPATHVEDNRIRPYRDPAPGELYAYIGEAFTRLQSLLRSQELDIVRSEEHTSELQSLMRISYAVFCLKKKKNRIRTTTPEQRKINIQDNNRKQATTVNKKKPPN